MEKEILFGMGRIDRIRFLACSNILFAAMVAAALIVMTLAPETNSAYAGVAVGVAWLLVSLKFVAQRYHDVGASGLWSLMYLTPGQPFIFVLLALVPGSQGSNKFGDPNPDSSLLLKTIALAPLFLVAGLAVWFQTEFEINLG